MESLEIAPIIRVDGFLPSLIVLGLDNGLHGGFLLLGRCQPPFRQFILDLPTLPA